MFLCHPSGEPIGIFKDATFPDHKVLLGRLNEISFEVPYEVERNHVIVRNPLIDHIRDRYLIKLVLGEQKEYYFINELDESMDESSDKKRVHAFSLGYELNDKLIREYEVISKTPREVLTDALAETIWSIGYIDVDFEIKRRSFEVPEKTVLDFVFEIAETFGAVVDFDTVNRKISLVNQDRIGNDKGFRIGYGKYAKTLSRNSKSDEQVTQFEFYGENGLSIRRVNPTGSPALFDFSFFLFPFSRDVNKNTIQSSYYMSDDLCHAILDYQDLVEEKQTEFSTLLSQKETHQTTLATKQTQMAQLQIEMAIIEDELDVAKAAGDDTSTLNQQKTTKQSQIDTKQSELDNVESDIDNIDNQILTLQNTLKLENNLSPDLIIERNKFLIRRTQSDTNYINDEDLYEDAIKRFEELKKPQTVFNINIVNFLEVLEEQRNWDKLNLGDTITIKYEKLGILVKAKIIEINYNYESGDINLTIANVTDIESDENKLIKMLYQSYSTATSVDMSKYKWDRADQQLGDINEYINSEYDATKKRIVAGVNESVEISRRGITIKNPDFPNEMLIATAGVLALSQDAGETWRTAIRPDRIVADVVAGKLIIGVNLLMENEAGKFTFDANGVRIDGTYLTIQKGSNGVEIHPDNGIVVTRGSVTKTILNATDGIKIQKNELGVWVDKLYTDTNGNLIAEDLVARKLIIRDSGGFTLIDADTKTINFTGFNVINGKDKVIRGVTVTNSLGQTTFAVDTEGNATMAGSLTINRGLNGNAYIKIDGNGLTAFNGSTTTFKIGADGNAEFSGKITGGEIISNTSIKVTTDLFVGDNIFLGSGYTGNKSLIFNSGARIDSSGVSLNMNCSSFYSNASYNSFDGSIQIYGSSHLDFYSYGGGLYMEDSTWVRVVNNKSFYTPGTIKGVIENISDRTMKKNIINLYDKGISALNTINKLNIYEYHMKTQSDDSLKDYGFMADELPEEFVSKGLEEGIPDSVKTYSIIAYLTKAVQELSAEVEYLKSKQ